MNTSTKDSPELSSTVAEYPVMIPLPFFQTNRWIPLSLASLLLPVVLLAQRSSAGDDAAACAACSMIVMVPVAILILNIVLLIWVARDAKARGMDGSILWMLLVFFLGVIGFVIYLFARPQGPKVRCHNCGNQRLQASVRCPHCASA